MQNANELENKNDIIEAEPKPAVTFNTFKDEIPSIAKERSVSFCKDSDNVTIPLDGPDSTSELVVSPTVSMKFFVL